MAREIFRYTIPKVIPTNIAVIFPCNLLGDISKRDITSESWNKNGTIPVINLRLILTKFQLCVALMITF